MDARGNNGPLIAAGGGLLLFISLFLGWIGGEGFDSLSAWEFFDILDIVLAAIALLAVAVGASIATGNALNVPGGAGPAVYTAGLIALSIVAVHILDPFSIAGEGVDREFGLFVALIGTIGMIVGGLQLGRDQGAAPATRTRPATDAPPPPPPPPAAGV